MEFTLDPTHGLEAFLAVLRPDRGNDQVGFVFHDPVAERERQAMPFAVDRILAGIERLVHPFDIRRFRTSSKAAFEAGSRFFGTGSLMAVSEPSTVRGGVT